MRKALTLCLALSLASCRPSSVTEAESKGDVKYLAAQGTPDAVEALGRVADKDPEAEKALTARAATDINVYIAAWQAVGRGATWGDKMIRYGLSDASRAELAASAMTRKDPHLDAFTDDLSNAIVSVGDDQHVVSLPAVLASAGARAQGVITQRLADGKTRETMCRGLASVDASAESRATFTKVPAASRDGKSCLRAAAQIAQTDDAALGWLGGTAETGLLRAAGDDATLKCDRLATAWKRAFSDRPATERAGLSVPLAAGLKRCPKDLDPIVAPVVETDAASVVVAAIEPSDPSTSELKQTCARLPLVLRGKLDARLRDRASDAVSQGCARAR